MRTAAIGILVCVLLKLLSVAAFGAGREETARIVGVQDGDTVTAYAPGRPQFRIRLVEIDAPESGQPYGRASKQVLSDLVFGKTVRIRSEGQDRYGRTLARLHVGELDVNAAMVWRGAAWVYADYNRDPSLPPLQARARRERVGLWAVQADQVIPPWEWRRARRSESPAPTSMRERVAPPRSGGVAAGCSAKTRCAQMDSCEEARAHLRQCGRGMLDGDGDGVPCEAICRG